MIIHLDGHAILPSDMQAILDYCDVSLRGMPRPVDPDGMRGNLFLRHNRNVLDPLFAPYLQD